MCPVQAPDSPPPLERAQMCVDNYLNYLKASRQISAVPGLCCIVIWRTVESVGGVFDPFVMTMLRVVWMQQCLGVTMVLNLDCLTYLTLQGLKPNSICCVFVCVTSGLRSKIALLFVMGPW